MQRIKNAKPDVIDESPWALAKECRETIEANDLKGVIHCLKNKRLNINVQDWQGNTFLQIALTLWTQYQKELEYIPPHYLDHHKGSSYKKITLTRKNLLTQEAIIHLLLHHGARIDIKNNLNKLQLRDKPILFNEYILNPLKNALKNKDNAALLRLMKLGTDPNEVIWDTFPDKNLVYSYPLLCAAIYDNREALTLLLDHGAETEKYIARHVDATNRTIRLMIYMSEMYPIMAECVFEHIPKPIIRNAWNNVALPWLLISKRMSLLPRDLSIVIANWLVWDDVLHKQINRTYQLYVHSDKTELLSEQKLATFNPAWLKNYWQTLATRAQKLDAGLLPSETVNESTK